MARVLLFDIDGTLIRSGGAGARALRRALSIALEREVGEVGFSFAGMTDRAIFRRVLAELGADDSDASVARILELYPEILRREVAEATRYGVAPGVREGLDALAPLPGVALGLGTGNVEVGARIKLERVDLNRYFAFGGFGCDAEDRGELLFAGACRGAERLGKPLDACEILVVGDTPRDVAAAHAIGARCLAVATGGATAPELRAAGADFVFDSLAAPAAREVLFG